MSGSRQYVERDGVPVKVDDLLAWGRELEKADRRVAADMLPDGVRVSTVFLGLDHGFGEGPPILYETMVFGGPSDGDCERYSTRAEALAGHAAVVARLKAPTP